MAPSSKARGTTRRPTKPVASQEKASRRRWFDAGGQPRLGVGSWSTADVVVRLRRRAKALRANALEEQTHQQPPPGPGNGIRRPQETIAGGGLIAMAIVTAPRRPARPKRFPSRLPKGEPQQHPLHIKAPRQQLPRNKATTRQRLNHLLGIPPPGHAENTASASAHLGEAGPGLLPWRA